MMVTPTLSGTRRILLWELVARQGVAHETEGFHVPSGLSPETARTMKGRRTELAPGIVEVDVVAHLRVFEETDRADGRGQLRGHQLIGVDQLRPGRVPDAVAPVVQVGRPAPGRDFPHSGARPRVRRRVRSPAGRASLWPPRARRQWGSAPRRD